MATITKGEIPHGLEDRLNIASSMLAFAEGVVAPPIDLRIGEEAEPLDLSKDERYGLAFILLQAKEVIDEVANNL